MFLTLFKTGRGGDRYYTLHDLQRDLFSKYTLVIYSGIVGKKGNEKNCVILNPHWATEAVYLILFDEKVIDQAGEFDVSDIERIWNDPKYKYKHADLLELIIKFELCYEL